MVKALILFVTLLINTAFAGSDESENVKLELANKVNFFNYARTQSGTLRFKYESKYLNDIQSGLISPNVTYDFSEDVSVNTYRIGYERKITDFVSLDGSIGMSNQNYSSAGRLYIKGAKAPDFNKINSSFDGISEIKIEPKFHAYREPVDLFAGLPISYFFTKYTFSTGASISDFEVNRYTVNPYVGISKKLGISMLGAKFSYLFRGSRKVSVKNGSDYTLTKGNSLLGEVFYEAHFNNHWVAGVSTGYFKPFNYSVSSVNATYEVPIESKNSAYGTIPFIWSDTSLIPKFTYYSPLKTEFNGLSYSNYSHYEISTDLEIRL